MIVVEVTCVDAPLGLNTAQMLVIDDDKYIPGMTRLASAIHEKGAKAVLQISHTGRGARRKITGHQPVGPSAVAMPYSFMMGLSNEEPRELTIDEIHDIEENMHRQLYVLKKLDLMVLKSIVLDTIWDNNSYLRPQILEPMNMVGIQRTEFASI